MKKLFAFILSTAVLIACALGVCACRNGGTSDGDKEETKVYSVYAPDGAPALSLTGIIGSDDTARYDINVVKAETINTFVAGETPQADFAIMPVNAAVKLLGSGEKYKMLGTVTHGNLFLMKKEGGGDISAVADLSKLIGKTVGVINLANVPGLTLKTILKDNNVEYVELKDGAGAAADKVNLLNVTAQEAIPANQNCDYFVVPEPAASTKKAGTQGKLDFAGSLQELYGGTGGYPQAVAVAKTSVIRADGRAVTNFMAMLERSSEALKNKSAETVVNAVRGWIKGDTAPTFTAANLTAQVIANCGVDFKDNELGKQKVLAYMEKINAVSNNAFGTPSDNFFYGDAFYYPV